MPKVTYARSLDLSGSREGAGGIGGLLAPTDNSTFISECTEGAVPARKEFSNLPGLLSNGSDAHNATEPAHA